MEASEKRWWCAATGCGEVMFLGIHREESVCLKTKMLQTSYILMPLLPLSWHGLNCDLNSVNFFHHLRWTKFQSWQWTWHCCHNSLIKVKLTNWYGHVIQHHIDIWDSNYSWLSIRIPSFQPFIIDYSKMRSCDWQSASPNFLLLCRSPLAQSFTMWGWLLSCFMEWDSPLVI
jgi:hypothetical protein